MQLCVEAATAGVMVVGVIGGGMRVCILDYNIAQVILVYKI